MLRRPPRSTLFPTRRSSDLPISTTFREGINPRRIPLPEGSIAPSDLGDLGAALKSPQQDRKSTRLNSSHSQISYAVFCLKKKRRSIDARATTTQIGRPRRKL